jgi:HEPN domain
VSGQTAKALARSERELGAARTLAEGGFSEQAVSRAYFACFYAAEAALLSLGETRSRPPASSRPSPSSWSRGVDSIPAPEPS